MRQSQDSLTIRSGGEGLFDITSKVEGWLAGQTIAIGILTLFCRHTSASLIIQENADPDVQSDLIDHFNRLAPQEPHLYRHGSEGPDDMPAHIRSALTATSLTIPVRHGRLALGTWQGIYLFEHRRRSHDREIVLHLIGEPS
ncbi:MAG: secondary thiamine-phosphate synthase enzyme YjbQ [Pseudomonadota bacterium]